jgi:hypothetical protein
MRFGKVAFAALMLAVTTYLLLPTVDELIIHPIFALFLVDTLDIPYTSGIFLSIILYRAVGVGCLLLALLVGGKPVFYALKEKINKNSLPKNALSQILTDRIRRFRRRQFAGR